MTANVDDVVRGRGVFVGKGVCVGSSFCGRGVDGGMSAWVSATMVKAAATAVFCTSTACMVGAAGAPHALMSRAMATTVRVEKRFILCEYLLMNLAIGKATAQCGNTVIFYNNFPIAFCDVESAKRFEILFAGDKRSSAVLPNGSGETVTGDD
jgi:hypothetical protein